MGQLSKAERDLLQKLMKAREGRDSTVKQSKVASESVYLFRLVAAGIGNLLLSTLMHTTKNLAHGPSSQQ